MLRVAVPNKGRLSEDAVALLRAIGLKVHGAAQRTLLVSAGGGRYQILFARAQDIPEFVENGAADLGITGLDLVEEHATDLPTPNSQLPTKSQLPTPRRGKTAAGGPGDPFDFAQGKPGGSPLVRLLDLPFGRCKLVVAAPEGAKVRTLDDVPANARVATAFPRLTAAFFARRKKKIAVIPVSGAAEIAPSIGVADLVVDLVETGSTLKQNHLALVDVILDSWAVLIGTRRGGPPLGADLSAEAPSGAKEEARRAKAAVPPGRAQAEVEEFVSAVRSVTEAEAKRYVMANVPRKALARARALLPGITGPTVMPLTGRRGWVAVHAVAPEEAINALIPKLRAVGAEGILVLPIERIVV